MGKIKSFNILKNEKINNEIEDAILSHCPEGDINEKIESRKKKAEARYISRNTVKYVLKIRGFYAKIYKYSFRPLLCSINPKKQLYVFRNLHKS